eukprot:TRINITY_DN7983_c0_g1_i2.p1 TRINITY_DN7983_c0_g1~~TRINITY_DN7983_c0_g1_i2.p1  ORF type:complete len:486 (-),score=121.76 TRINITY_DN7983_c0_g1_i2:1102-2559(-)
MEFLGRLGDLVQEFIVMVILTIAFAWMVSKLVGIVVDFQQGNLSIERADDDAMNLDSSAIDGEDMQQDRSLPSDEEESDVAENWSLLQVPEEHSGHVSRKPTDKAEAVVDASSSEETPQTSIEDDLVSERGGTCSVSARSPDEHQKQETVFERGLELATDTETHTDESNTSINKTGKAQVGDNNAVVVKKSQKVIDEEDEEDWEGIEAGELEEEFDLAATFIASSSMGPGIQASQEVQLLLYALYKQATVGSCIISQPSVFNIGAKAKWDAWKKLGKMEQEEAMARYIGTVSQMYPNWNSPPPPGDESPENQTQDLNSRGAVTPGDSAKVGSGEGSSRGQSSSGHGLGPVFSSLVYTPDETQPLTKGLHDLHVHAKDGNLDDMKRLLDQGVSPNETDGEGCTALHWAADRGHLETVRALLAAGASINAQDGEGQTPLHYAITCDYKNIAEVLVKAGADVGIPDKDGVTPAAACPPSWNWKEMASS